MLSRDWTGRSVILIGGGPSLTGFDFERMRGRAIVVAINDAFRVAPWADCVLSIDTMWWNRRWRDMRRVHGERIAIVPEMFVTRCEAHCLRRVRRDGVSLDMGAVHSGDNSGFAALGMAIMRGASKVALLGYDMNGRGHFHAGYSWHTRFDARFYRDWSAKFQSLVDPAMAGGTDIINCNPHSAIRCFRFGVVDEVFEHGQIPA